MSPIKIPQRIDDPPHLLIWSADEFIPMMLGLVFGIAVGKAAIFCFIGFLVTRSYRKFRDNSPDGYMLHALYYWGFLPPKARSMINPYIRRLLP